MPLSTGDTVPQMRTPQPSQQGPGQLQPWSLGPEVGMSAPNPPGNLAGSTGPHLLLVQRLLRGGLVLRGSSCMPGTVDTES